ncbi:MAG TPA: ATP-binding protein [Kofleriaceae bacterium]|nr:ATP-binding protein [Kofleriaceae bacterium]
MSDMPDWLDEVVREVRLHAEAALVRRLDAGAGFADPRVASQIYLRDEAALARIAGGTLRPQGTHRRAAEELARALAEASTSDGPRLRLAVLADRLGLDVTARALLAAAIAYALDLDTRELVHALAARRKPALYLETCADVLQLSPAALLGAIAPGAALHAGHALVVDGDGLDATLAISAPLLAWLLGREELQPPLAGACQLVTAQVELGVALPPQVVAQLDQLAPRVRRSEPIAIVLRGPRGSGRRAAAHHLARTLGRPLLAISIPALLAAEQRGRTTLLGAALAAARLRDAVPFLADADALYDESGTMTAAHAEAIAGTPGLLVAASTGRGGHLELRRPALAVAMPRAELDDRRAAWEHALALRDAPATHAGELAARYVIGPGAIADVVLEADRFARAAGMPLELEALEAAVSRRLSLRLGTFGTVVSRKALMSELVLPDEVIDTLRDMIAMVRERAQILERWGYQRHLGISRGVAALYSGEPGTGKTMAASVVASELGLELVRIDLSAVVSKWVGETEKNLARIFDEAQDAHAMLLFDEADSLFGKRTELKSAQDRFANLEVNYILQRMETFDGVSVLTTNAESSIDPALQRRLNFRIRFPEPELEEREKLWRQLLPPATELHDRVDFRALAERFDMTGGYIKNAVVRAAVIAARAGRAMVAEDLWLGAHHEYVEMGKVMPHFTPPGGGL